ncbi:MAG: DUF3943 domain-containing protein [Acidobacteria bacterium]|jgi:hypothetical protein|nr:DUF3943 domain-containing protein [Acidobacteriota bacterium]
MTIKYKKTSLLCLLLLCLTLVISGFHLTAEDNIPNNSNCDKKQAKNVKRAIWEGLAHFAYATSSYWIRQDVMKEDWEYQFTWEDQKKRIFQLDGFRLDSNSYAFNWTHSLAGGIYYNYARTNYFNKSESLLYSITCSFLWESLVEFREVISINDMIATPLGGLGFGEATFQLGRLFRSQRPTFFNKIARIISNPVMAINGWMDRKKYKNPYAIEDGQSWNDCRFVIGPRFDTMKNEKTNTLMHVAMETQLFNLPGYGEQGTVNSYMKDTLFSEFNLGMALSSKGMYQFDILAKAVLFGYFYQNILGSSEAQNRKGYSLFIGAATAFDVMCINPDKLDNIENSSIPDKEDKHCIINLLGPYLDLTVYKEPLKIRIAADAYADFALIHSHVYKKYAELYPEGTTKSTLWEHGYYYGLGYTLSSMLQIDYANFEFKGAFKYHYYDSVDGIDRFQKDISPGCDFNLKDRRTTYRLTLGYTIPKTPIQLSAGFEKINRWGTLEHFARSSSEKRSFFQVQYLF